MNVTLNEEMCEELFRQILKVDFEEHCAWIKDQAWRTKNISADEDYFSEDVEYDKKLNEAYKMLLNHYYTEAEAKEIVDNVDKEIEKYSADV